MSFDGEVLPIEGNDSLGLDVLPIDNPENREIDISADPYAGQTAGNGKLIWTPEDAADNLNRPGMNWTFGNNGALDDGILTFGFWNSLAEVQASYYTEADKDGIILTADGDYIAAGVFAPFNDAQRAMAIANLQLWDDLIDIQIRPATSAAEADITFGFTQMSPAAGAHAYYPQEEALNDYGYVTAGRVSGDVWANYLYPGSFTNTNPGAYAWFAITHELGHSLGLAHGGDYNASQDRDGDGKPDPITYSGSAYFYQDSQQYTIMSYFDGRVTGQAAVLWNPNGGTFQYAQTPAVHDILAVQNVYGADYSTRAGDTTYGFNSNADRVVFDFTQNKAPIVTIWDGAGNDTLDLSGFNANNVIDINEGAFSSAGYMIDPAYKAKLVAAGYTEALLATFYARNGLGPDGRPVDNIAIAYGAKIENAIGGSGNDQINGNGLDNVLTGNGGNDVIYGRDGNDTLNGGIGNDQLFGGTGNDILAGGAGADAMSGGTGDDIYDVDLAGDSVTEAASEGIDTVRSAIDYALGANVENLTLVGAALNGTGNSLDNVLNGNESNNSLDGGAGNDRLFGGAGDDFLIGGSGRDVFNGGAGNDTIVIDTLDTPTTPSKVGELFVEFVQDFNALGDDTIDLSRLDANTRLDGDQAFSWIGTNANKAAGDLSYKVYDSINGAEKALGIEIDGIDGVGTNSGPVTIVFANVDGGTPDYALVLLGTSGVSQSDFLF